MTRILVQRGSAGGSSSNPNRNPSLSSSSTRTENQGSSRALSTLKDEDIGEVMREQVAADEFLERSGSADSKTIRASDDLEGGFQNDQLESSTAENVYNKPCTSDNADSCELEGLSGLRVAERCSIEKEGLSGDSSHSRVSPPPPPPPMLPPKFLTANSNARRSISGNSNAVRIGPSRRAVGRSLASTRALPSESLPSSPRSHGEYEGYNSADEQSPSFGASYDNLERECQFENDIRLVKGYEVKHMLEDGNCLFRAVADQVYGDSELHDLARQMCIDYMEHERDHFAQFITEGFSSYCKRKRRDKVYGNNIEIQAFAEMYNRPIHIYSYSTEPINIFHGSYNTESPPLRLSYHRGNHYNSLVDPRRLAVGAGLGFSSLRGANVGKDQVKAAIKAQQDHQIDNALLAEGRFYSDMELTEKEIERMVMEASRKEYLADDKFKQQSGTRKSSSDAEPSSSGARPPSRSEKKAEPGFPDVILSSSSIQMVLSMGFNYLKVIEAYSIFGDDVDSMVCYLLETGGGSRLKGKATE